MSEPESPLPSPSSSPAAGRTGASVLRRLLDLSMPVIGLNVLQVLSLAVDTAMCGRLPDADSALVALGFATQLVFLLMVAMLGLTVGTVALVARAHGGGDGERVNHVLEQSSALTVLLSILVGALGLALGPAALALLGAGPEASELGMVYLVPLLVATPFYYLNILYAAVLRGVGNTRLAFYVALAANGLNVVINYALILGNLGMPALGLQGAALGTAISYAFSTLAMVVLLRRGTVAGVELRLWPRGLDRVLARTLFRIGLPAAIDMVVLNAAFMSIVGMLSRVDELAVAAHGVGLRIQSLAFVPGLSISTATSAMVGQALGAGQPQEARAVVRASVALCTAVMGVLGLAIVVGDAALVSVFEIDPVSRLGELSRVWIQQLGYSMPVVGVYIAYVGMLRGAGESTTSLNINVIGTIAFQIPLSALLGFAFGLGAFGIWLAFPLSFVVKAGLAGWVYRRGHWARPGAAL